MHEYRLYTPGYRTSPYIVVQGTFTAESFLKFQILCTKEGYPNIDFVADIDNISVYNGENN